MKKWRKKWLLYY